MPTVTDGICCPVCGGRLAVQRTRHYPGKTVRHHVCQTPGCAFKGRSEQRLCGVPAISVTYLLESSRMTPRESSPAEPSGSTIKPSQE